MRYQVTNARPLSEGNDGLLIDLNYLASLAIEAGTEKLGDKNLLVRNNTLYVKSSQGYLAIKPSGKKVTEKLFWVNDDLTPILGLFSINLDDVKKIAFYLNELLPRRGIDTTKF